MKIAAGVAPVPALIAAGVAVGLGTDGAGSNNDLDDGKVVVRNGRVLTLGRD